MANELQAKITADISGLEAGLKQAQKLQDDYSKKIEETKKAIIDNNSIMANYRKAIQDLNRTKKDGTINEEKYNKELQRLQKQLLETKVETNNFRKSLLDLNKGYKEAVTESKRITNELNSSSKGMTSLGKSTANATPTVIEFSRVIQDAPYGIQGVANNIQQLTTNFGYLQKQAGGTVPALKAFAGSFLGPAGIVFAVSAVTSLLITYGDELFKSKSETEKLAEATKKADDKLDDFVETLSDKNKALLEGEKSAAKEITSINLLRGQIENVTNSTKLRLDGIKRLRDEFGGYFKGISDESLLNGTAAASYDVLTNSILKRAKATAATGLLVKNAERELEINEKIKKNNEDIIALGDDLNKASGRLGVGDDLGESIKAAKIEGKIVDIINEQIELQTRLGEITKANNELKSVVIENEVIIPDDQKIDDTAANKIKKTEEKLSKEKEKIRLRDIEIDNYVNDEIFRNAEETTKGVQAIYKTFADDVEKTADNTDIINADKAFKEIQDIANKIKDIQKSFPKLQLSEVDFAGLNLDQLTAIETKLQSTQEKINLFSNATKAAFSSMALSLSQSMNTGSAILDSFISSLISGFAEILAAKVSFLTLDKGLIQSEISADQARASSDGIAIATSAATALGPGGAIALPGIIASQLAIINGAFAGVRAMAFAHGGVVPGGSFVGDKVPAFLNSGEIVMNGRQQANTLMAIAEGNANYGRNTTKDSDITINAVLRGQNQIVQFNRASKFNKRFNG